MGVLSKPTRQPDFKTVDEWGRTILIWWEEEILQVMHDCEESSNPISISCYNWHWYSSWRGEWFPLKGTFSENEMKSIKEAYAEWLLEKELLG